MGITPKQHICRYTKQAHKGMKQKLSFAFFIFLISSMFAVRAQSVFYSQYYRAQMMLNPALTGSTPEKWRFTGLWQSKTFDTTLSHSTKLLFAEYTFSFRNKYRGYGLVTEDKTPITFGFGLGSEWRDSPLSWHKFVSAYGSLAIHVRPSTESMISVGVQPGVFEGAGYYPIQQSNYSPFDTLILPGRQYRLHFDYNAGIVVGFGKMDCWIEDQQYKFMLGASAYHLNRAYRMPLDDHLPGKELHAHISYLWDVNNKIGLIPRIMYLYEGQHLAQGGVVALYRRHFGNFDRLRMGLAYKSDNQLSASAGVRFYGSKDKTLSADLEISYDYLIGAQTTPRIYKNAFEISLIISPLTKCWSQSECSGTYQLESY